jgi:tRNA A-37 threonylcarbamoyl transferase component Bud32
MSYLKTVGDKTFFVLAVDQWVFERDVEVGLLGEAIAGKLLFPYTTLIGDQYLHSREVMLKKRLIQEMLENLAATYPELTVRMHIKPQYFLYEALLSRVRMLPLLNPDASNLSLALKANEATFLSSYLEALHQMQAEGKVLLVDDYVRVSERFISQSKDPKIRLLNLTKNAPRTLFTSFFGLFPQIINVFSKNAEAFIKTQKFNWQIQPNYPYLFGNPQDYVFFQTSTGLLSLSDKIDIKGFAQKMLLDGNNEDIEVEPIGGMINDVYVLHAHHGSGETKVLVKRFKDWSWFKWFPLTVWSYATRPMILEAQARLAKECAIGDYLRSEGFNVPRVLHVSNAERLIFMEYIEGVSLSETIKTISAAQPSDNIEVELAQIEMAGEIMAHVHERNVVLGDTKPDNILVRPDGSLFMIDFEQASQGGEGDKTWDVAVFLYYAGHYVYPINGAAKAEAVTKAFIQGYLKADGDAAVIKKAALPKYTRVFSIFTMWSIIAVIANVCKKVEDPK